MGGDSPTSSMASSGASAYNSAASLPGSAVLPRADVLVLGGDLAYPNPSNETYEKRLFRSVAMATIMCAISRSLSVICIHGLSHEDDINWGCKNACCWDRGRGQNVLCSAGPSRLRCRRRRTCTRGCW